MGSEITEVDTQIQPHRHISSFQDRLATFVKEDGITVLIVFVLVTAYALLRTQGDTFESQQALLDTLQDSNPTVIEFYSNNCSICLTSKPKVIQLERDLQETARVIKLNIKEPVNQALANQWGVRGVPTFFVINTDGEVVYASAGAPDIEAITNKVFNILGRE